jgi:hypothetical protein
MTTPELVTFLIGAACYVLLLNVGVRGERSPTISMGAGLGPAMAAYGVAHEGDAFVVFVVPIAATFLLLAARSHVREGLAHSVLYGSIAAGAFVLSASGRWPAFITAIIGAMGYAIVDGARRRTWSQPGDEATALLLLGVFLCSAGLTVLIADRMGWPAFAAMAAVLALTKREFDSFALSRVALKQTVVALESLAASPTL